MIWDPYQAAAEASTGARILADGTGHGRQLSVLFQLEEFLADDTKAVDVVLDALNETDAWTKNNIQAVAEQLSPSVGLPASVLAVSLRRESYGIMPISDEVIASQQRIADTFLGLGLVPKADHGRGCSTQAGVLIMTKRASSSANILWFLPTHGDGRYLGTTLGGRDVNFNYLRQIAQAADQLGYFGVLLPTGRSCEDSWVVASAVAPWTERLRYLVAVRPGLQSPSVAARMTATLDRVSNGRLLVNVVTGGDPVENKGDGIFLDHDERYAVTREFLNVYSDLLAGKTVNVEGKHIHIEDGRLLFLPVQSPRPPLYFGGSSDAGIDVAVDTVDKYLTWGEPPAQVAEKVNRVKAAAAKRGRKLSFGIRLHVIVRETNAEAWKAADELIAARHRRHAGLGAEDILAHGLGWPAADGAIAWRTPRPARDQPESLGRRRPGARRRRHGAGRRSAHRGGAHQGISGRRHRYLHHVGLSASRGSLSLRRTGVSAAVAVATAQCDAASRQYRAVRRNHRQRASAAGEGIAIMSLIESLPRLRSWRIPRADGLIQWIVPLAILLVWQAACVSGLVPARVLPAPSDVALAGWKLLLSGELARNIWVSFWRASVGFVDRRRHRLCLRAGQRPVAAQQQADRHDAADGAQHSASGADPAGHPVVRHR